MPDDFPEIQSKEESPKRIIPPEVRSIPPESPQHVNLSDDDADNSPTQDDKTSVYSVATENEIAQLFGEYKKRKQNHAMPTSSTAPSGTSWRKNPFNSQSQLPDPSISPEIELQRKNSIFKVGNFVLACYIKATHSHSNYVWT